MDPLKVTGAFIAIGLFAPAGTATISAASASATSSLKIQQVNYDSQSLNGEWIVIKNTGKTTRSLRGWKISDRSGYTYTFPTTSLKAGSTVKVHTGSGANQTGVRFWGRSGYVWSDKGDKAWLKNASGKTVDTCTYAGGKTSVAC